MRTDVLELDAAIHPRVADLRLDRGDVEALRLVLAGGSVIDWHKAAFVDRASVDRLLQMHLLDLTDPFNRTRLRYLFNESVAYVEELIGVRIQGDLRDPADIRDVFLWASDTSGFRRRQMLSCMVLKLMHVISHMEAADLKLRADVSDYDLMELAHRRVVAASEAMRGAVPMVAFYGSRKTRASVIQKLLAKRDNVAVTIFDKLRYRVVVPRHEDLMPALAWLTRNLVPFNMVTPGQSHNNLLDPSLLETVLPPEEASELQALVDDPVRVDVARNELSGSTYRTVNFIADLPVEIPPHLLPKGDHVHHGRVVFTAMELQLVDEGTARDNERGDNAHERYKARQWERVQARLGRGAYVK